MFVVAFWMSVVVMEMSLMVYKMTMLKRVRYTVNNMMVGCGWENAPSSNTRGREGK